MQPRRGREGSARPGSPPQAKPVFFPQLRLGPRTRLGPEGVTFLPRRGRRAAPALMPALPQVTPAPTATDPDTRPRPAIRGSPARAPRPGPLARAGPAHPAKPRARSLPEPEPESPAAGRTPRRRGRSAAGCWADARGQPARRVPGRLVPAAPRARRPALLKLASLPPSCHARHRTRWSKRRLRCGCSPEVCRSLASPPGAAPTAALRGLHSVTAAPPRVSTPPRGRTHPGELHSAGRPHGSLPLSRPPSWDLHPLPRPRG